MTIRNKSPYPWPGAKQRIAAQVWDALGDVDLYVEPFFGSGAVLLSRPEDHKRKRELINDIDGYVCNFWRAVQADPEGVAALVDPVVCELDLHARNTRLIAEREAFTERLRSDPEYFDARLAAWWAWGQSVWIGCGWASAHKFSKPVCKAGRWPDGILHPGRQPLDSCLSNLGARLDRVTVYCGDWRRCVTSAIIKQGGATVGVFLDPPYRKSSTAGAIDYTGSDDGVSEAVGEWCAEWGARPWMRIVLTGHAGEHEHLEALGWRASEWSRGATFGRTAGRKKERIWHSPACLGDDRDQGALFGGILPKVG